MTLVRTMLLPALEDWMVRLLLRRDSEFFCSRCGAHKSDLYTLRECLSSENTGTFVTATLAQFRLFQVRSWRFPCALVS